MEQVERIGREQRAQYVESIQLGIGPLSGVEPRLLEQAFYIARAGSIAEIIQEVASARVTERGGRADDRRSEAAMEDRKKQGYF